MNSNNNSNDLQLLNTLHARMLSTIFAKTISEEEMLAFVRAKEALKKQIPNYVSVNKCMNADNTTKAVEGLDIFTKNWCMNCSKTKEQHDLIFRCKECEFKKSDGECLVKIFAHEHKHDYPMGEFGSMGCH